jgi:peptidoglycan hydrolase-like protein with peptidoglycan-binding domain
VVAVAKKIEFEIIDNCPVPQALADEVLALKQKTGATLNSCDRSPEAEPFLKRLGKMSQRQLFDGFQAGRPGFNPANPPGRSTHERRNDGAAYPGRAGARLEDWQVGMDWTDPQGVVRAASKRGWLVTVTYPTNAREAHHLNFRKAPELEVALGRGDKGPKVEELTEKLARLRSPKTTEPYLSHRHVGYDKWVAGAVRRFQEDYHQKVDGKYGSQTATQLEVALREQKQRERRDYRRGDKGPEVERLTKALTVLLDDDGKPYMKRSKERYDQWTERAVARFQAEHRLDDDGVFGPKTRTKLYRALEKHEEKLAKEKEKAAEAKEKKGKRKKG